MNQRSKFHILDIKTKNSIENAEYFMLFILFSSLPLSIAISQISLGLLLGLLIYKFYIMKHPLSYTPFETPILLFVFINLVSAIFGLNVLWSIVDVFKSNWFISLYFLIVNFVDSKKKASFFLCVIFSGAALNGLYGILQHFLGGFDLFRPEGSEKIFTTGVDGEIRASGTFSIYTTYSGQMLLFMLFGIGFLLFGEGRVLTHCSSLALPFIFGGLIFSFTRSSWLGLIGGLLSHGYFKGKKGLAFILLSIMITTILFLVFFPPIGERAKSILNFKNDIAAQERIQIWKATGEIILGHPFLGVGPGNFWIIFDQYREKYQVVFYSTAHNNFLHITAELGVIGLVSFLYFWFVIFKQGFLSARKLNDPFSKGIVIGSLGALVGIHVAGFFEFNFGDDEVAMVMWVMVGFIAAARRGNFDNKLINSYGERREETNRPMLTI